MPKFTIIFIQGGRRHWTVNFTGTQSYLTTLSASLAQKLLISNGWFQTFQPIILRYKKGNFHNWGCISVYLLSYPLKFMDFSGNKCWTNVRPRPRCTRNPCFKQKIYEK